MYQYIYICINIYIYMYQYIYIYISIYYRIRLASFGKDHFAPFFLVRFQKLPYTSIDLPKSPTQRAKHH